MTLAKWLVLGIRIVSLGVAATLSALSWRKFRDSMASEVPKVDSTWGGFGGTLGGWSISRSMAWLLITVVTLMLFAVLALRVEEPFVQVETTADKKGTAAPE